MVMGNAQIVTNFFFEKFPQQEALIIALLITIMENISKYLKI